MHNIQEASNLTGWTPWELRNNQRFSLYRKKIDGRFFFDVDTILQNIGGRVPLSPTYGSDVSAMLTQIFLSDHSLSVPIIAGWIDAPASTSYVSNLLYRCRSPKSTLPRDETAATRAVLHELRRIVGELPPVPSYSYRQHPQHGQGQIDPYYLTRGELVAQRRGTSFCAEC